MFHLLVKKSLSGQEESKSLSLFLVDFNGKKRKESFLQVFKAPNKKCLNVYCNLNKCLIV